MRCGIAVRWLAGAASDWRLGAASACDEATFDTATAWSGWMRSVVRSGGRFCGAAGRQQSQDLFAQLWGAAEWRGQFAVPAAARSRARQQQSVSAAPDEQASAEPGTTIAAAKRATNTAFASRRRIRRSMCRIRSIFGVAVSVSQQSVKPVSLRIAFPWARPTISLREPRIKGWA